MEKEQIHQYVNSLTWEKSRESKKAKKYFLNEEPSSGVLEVLHNAYYNHESDRREGITHKYLYAIFLVLHENEIQLIPYLYDAFKKDSTFDLATQQMGLLCFKELRMIPTATSTYQHTSEKYDPNTTKEYVLDFDELFEQLMVIMKANGKINSLHAFEALTKINKFPEYIIPDLPNADVLELDDLLKKFAKIQKFSHQIKFKEEMLNNRKEVLLEAFKAISLQKKGNPQEALEILDRLIEKDPYCEIWQYFKASALLDVDADPEQIPKVQALIDHALRVSGYHYTHNYYAVMAKLMRLSDNKAEAAKYLKLPVSITVPRDNYTPDDLWDVITRSYKQERYYLKKFTESEKIRKRKEQGIQLPKMAAVDAPQSAQRTSPAETLESMNRTRFIKLKNAINMTTKIPFSVITKSLSFASIEALSSWLFEIGLMGLSLDYDQKMILIPEKDKILLALDTLIKQP